MSKIKALVGSLSGAGHLDLQDMLCCCIFWKEERHMAEGRMARRPKKEAFSSLIKI